MRFNPAWPLAGLLLTLAGCVPPQPAVQQTSIWAPNIGTVWKDPEGHLDSAFSAGALNPSVGNFFGGTVTLGTAHFHKLVVTGEGTFNNLLKKESKHSSYDYVNSFYPLNSSGLVNIVEELRSNGLPLSIKFSTRYAGIIPLRFQSANSNAWDVDGLIVGVRSVENWTPLQGITIDSEYDYKIHFGAETRILKTFPYHSHCKTAHAFYPATQISTNLTGQAIDITCSIGADNNPVDLTFSYLSDYGIALERKVASLESKTDYQIKSVEVVN